MFKTNGSQRFLLLKVFMAQQKHATIEPYASFCKIVIDDDIRKKRNAITYKTPTIPSSKSLYLPCYPNKLSLNDAGKR
jgi:hypothetical protein